MTVVRIVAESFLRPPTPETFVERSKVVPSSQEMD